MFVQATQKALETRHIDERRRTQSVRRSEVIERNEAYEAFTAACQFAEVTHGKAQAYRFYIGGTQKAQ